MAQKIRKFPSLSCSCTLTYHGAERVWPICHTQWGPAALLLLRSPYETPEQTAVLLAGDISNASAVKPIYR